MKTLITLSIACLGILLSSCGSNFTITKRHYNSGYYVDIVKNYKAKSEKKTEVAPALLPQATTASPEKTIVEQKDVVVNTNQTAGTVNNTSPISTKATKSHSNYMSHKRVKEVPVEQPQIMNKPVVQNDITTAPENISQDDNGRAALSLLWIVIVIVLILWLIGLLADGFGLGGLINLLLVIALILLILWLLRIA